MVGRKTRAGGGQRFTASLRHRLSILMALIALVGIGSGVIVQATARVMTSANSRLAETLVPLRVDAAELNLLYREQALDLSTGEVAAIELENTLATAQALRNRIRELAATTPALAQEFSLVEGAADAWGAQIMPAPGLVDPLAGEAERAELQIALSTLLTESALAVDDQQSVAADAARVARDTATLAAVGLLVVALAGAALLRRWIAAPVEQLTRQVDGVSTDLSRPITPAGPQELVSIGEAVESMRRQLLDDASHRIDSALIAGHEAERARIAGQIHDDQIQAMTLASIRLQQLRHQLRGEAEPVALVTSAQEATNGAIARLRRMIFELHSPSLETDGLDAAVEEYLDETFGNDVSWSVEGAPGPLSSGVAALAYRLAREAMFNTFKHANARTIEVSMVRLSAALTVTIRDDGVGFDGDAADVERGHLGFDHSRQLAIAAGGSWTCQSQLGGGTTVRFTLPVGAGPPPSDVGPAMTSLRHAPG